MAEQIIQTGLNSIIGKRYLDYAIYVAKGRALPSVFDGCKPVQRRILFDMHELGLFHNKPYKKSARVVGDVLGKYFAVLSRYYRRLRIIRTELSGDVVK